MLFFYIRHGDPIYNPDSLTPLGHRQAEAVGRRLAQFGMDKIYASTSNRAIQTAQPLCELVKKDLTQLDFANESHAWSDFTIPTDNGGRTWLFHSAKSRAIFATSEMRALGDNWFDHPQLKEICDYRKGVDRIYTELGKFFAELGYEQERGTGRFKVLNHTNERVALFAHQGFGVAFLSCLLDIPYPQYALHFDITHTGMTVIDFADEGGYAIPRVLTHSEMGHLFKDGLPLRYNGGHRF